jgi:AraC-like DNA-binding protein
MARHIPALRRKTKLVSWHWPFDCKRRELLLFTKNCAMPSDHDCLSVGHLRPDPRWRMAAHAHPHHELIIVLGGRMTLTAGGRTLTATAGDALLYPSGVRHAESAAADDPVESLFCAFRARRIAARRVMVAHDYDGRMRQMARWLHADEAHGARAADPVARARLFAALLTEFLRRDRQPEPPPRAALRQLTRQWMAEPLTVARLARASGLSRWHYIRRYHQLTGRTPMADVRQERLDGARDMLLTTELPLKEIARRCGLGGAQAFSRAFAARYGQPPGAFRHARLAAAWIGGHHRA